jgi:transcriptional regulator of acetoin/glycerol metabolism
VERVKDISSREESVIKANWDEQYTDRFTSIFSPVMKNALDAGHHAYVLAGKVSYDAMENFMKQNDIPGNVFEADNILLKTMVRSNPGLILLKDGEILKKWHWRQMEDFQTIKEKYIHD